MLRFSTDLVSPRSFFSKNSIFVLDKPTTDMLFQSFFKKIWFTFNFKKRHIAQHSLSKKFQFLFSNNLLFLTIATKPYFVNYALNFKILPYRNFFSNFIYAKFTIFSCRNYLYLLNSYNFFNNYNFFMLFFFIISNNKNLLFKKFNNLIISKESTNLLFNFNVKFI